MYIAAAVLVVLWLIGYFTGMAFGGWIHLLLVVGVILALWQKFGGKGQGDQPQGGQQV